MLTVSPQLTGRRAFAPILISMPSLRLRRFTPGAPATPPQRPAGARLLLSLNKDMVMPDGDGDGDSDGDGDGSGDDRDDVDVEMMIIGIQIKYYTVTPKLNSSDDPVSSNSATREATAASAAALPQGKLSENYWVPSKHNWPWS
jgi:hypothetical protein